jgi:hypothetical protein
MGKESMSRFGTFFVQLECHNYSHGQQVNGVVMLDLRANFPSSNITIKLEGKEKTKFWKSRQVYSHTDSEGRTHYRTEWYPVFGRHRIMNYEFPIAAFNGGFVPAGQYQLPFSFQLPSGIPNTFHKKWTDYSDCYAKIHYELKSKLQSSYGKELLKFKQPFSINNSLSAPIASKAVKVDKEVVCFCCCSKGRVKLNSYFEKNAYQPGETCFMVAEVENETSVKINHLKAVFFQHINVVANGWWGTQSKSWNHNLSVDYGGSYEPKTSRVGENAERIQVNLGNLEIKGGDDAGEVGGFNTTTKGHLIQCDYFVSAVCDMDTCICCDEHPNATINVEIYNDPKPTVVQFVAPPGWAPTQYDHYTANLNQQYQCADPDYAHEMQA